MELFIVIPLAEVAFLFLQILLYGRKKTTLYTCIINIVEFDRTMDDLIKCNNKLGSIDP